MAEMTGLFGEHDVYGPRIVELMFLNYMHCHDWAYECCWEPDAFGRLAPVVRLIRAHMICDWVVHYGTERAIAKKKRGWAYRRMMLAGVRREEFFAGAARRGLLADMPAAPTASWQKKQRLDFDHSLVEYAADLLLAPLSVSPARFRAIQQGLSALCREDGYGGTRWAFQLFETLGSRTDQTHDFLLTAARQLGRDAIESQCAEEFAVRTAIHKYGLVLTKDSISYVHEVLSAIAAQLDASELGMICESIAARIVQKG